MLQSVICVWTGVFRCRNFATSNKLIEYARKDYPFLQDVDVASRYVCGLCCLFFVPLHPVARPAQSIGEWGQRLYYAFLYLRDAVYHLLQGQPARDTHQEVAHGDDYVPVGCCLAVAVPTHYFPDSPYRVVVQGALVSLIAPTGTAAAVIAGRLGGNKTTLTTYTIVSNLVAAIMIPAVFPLVEIYSAGSFMEQFLLILCHVFPLLICPFLVAWVPREFMPKLHRLVVKFCESLTFYLWGISLIIAIGLTLRSVVNNHFYPHVLLLLAVSGLIVCAWQFGTGKLVGKHYHDYINCGQSLVTRLCRTTRWFWMYCSQCDFCSRMPKQLAQP